MSNGTIVSKVPKLPHLFKPRLAPGPKHKEVRDPMFDMVEPCRCAVEVGSQWGWWARRAARCLPQAKIYSVDLWPCTEPTEESYFEEIANIYEWTLNVKPWLGKRVFGLWGSSQYWAEKFPVVGTMPIDLLFIDADHMADSVYADCEAWVPLVRQDGLICGHDWAGRWAHEVRPGVKRYFDKIPEAKIQVGEIFYSGRRARLDLGVCWWLRKSWQESPNESI